MSIIGVDERRIRSIAKILEKTVVKPSLNVFDDKLYPSRGVDEELVLRYFLVMVAMDHRLSRPGKTYEACLDDGCYHGADLLYRLGKKMFDENPSFFSPDKLSLVNVDHVKGWLTVGGAQPPDPEVRALLLRDLGVKLMKLYGSSVKEMIQISQGRLRSTDGYGLLDLLRVFRAYEDPVEKKSLLLVKFLKHRGLFNPVDRLDIPVDNHLTRIALRLGLAMVSGTLWHKIRNGVETGRDEDLIIRLIVREAYRRLVDESKVDVGALDDYLWKHGREVCSRDNPRCSECVFKNACLARINRDFMVNEHVYYNTWYY